MPPSMLNVHDELIPISRLNNQIISHFDSIFYSQFRFHVCSIFKNLFLSLKEKNIWFDCKAVMGRFPSEVITSLPEYRNQDPNFWWVKREDTVNDHSLEYYRNKDPNFWWVLREEGALTGLGPHTLLAPQLSLPHHSTPSQSNAPPKKQKHLNPTII